MSYLLVLIYFLSIQAAIATILPGSPGLPVFWNADNCALPQCRCLSAVKTVDCSNQQLRELDLEFIPLNYFSGVEKIDLRRNHLTAVPPAGRILAIFPDLRQIFLSDNPLLTCLRLEELERNLLGTKVVLFSSLSCRKYHRQHSPSMSPSTLAMQLPSPSPAPPPLATGKSAVIILFNIIIP